MREDEDEINLNAKTAVKIFDQKNIRTAWDDENEEWYFSITDVVGILTERKNPTAY